MTDITKARIMALYEGLKNTDKRIAIVDTPDGAIIGINDERGFLPLAAIWPDAPIEDHKPRTIGFQQLPSDEVN